MCARTTYAISVLMEARRLLEKFPTDNGETYLQICNFYRELAPEEAPQALGLPVQQLNQIHYPEPG